MGSNGIEDVVTRVLRERGDLVSRNFLIDFAIEKIENERHTELNDDEEAYFVVQVPKAIARLVRRDEIIPVVDGGVIFYTLPPPDGEGKHKKSLKRGKKRRTSHSFKKSLKRGKKRRTSHSL